MPQKDKIVIWPPYLDSKESRSGGRRVARRNAVKSPTTDEIVAALISLNPDLDPIVEETKAYPASWWNTSGRVLVAKTQTPKSSILREVASEIKKMRSAN